MYLKSILHGIELFSEKMFMSCEGVKLFSEKLFMSREGVKLFSKKMFMSCVRSRLKSESKNKTFSKSQNDHAQIKVVQS